MDTAGTAAAAAGAGAGRKNRPSGQGELVSEKGLTYDDKALGKLGIKVNAIEREKALKKMGLTEADLELAEQGECFTFLGQEGKHCAGTLSFPFEFCALLALACSSSDSHLSPYSSCSPPPHASSQLGLPTGPQGP